MKQMTVISGKGGTGKTSLVASFASLTDHAVLADCDVDAADLHLILRPKIIKTMGFHGLKLASVEQDKCTDCKACIAHCHFQAINKDIEVNKKLCEGCGVCSYICPEDAIEMIPRQSGVAYISETRFGPMVHAKLNTGEEASGKLVSLVRENAILYAKEKKKQLILIDGPPGTGCPVISAISGVDIVLIVTEPTMSAIHDLERILGVARHFNILAVVCINKYDINNENAENIKTYCRTHNVSIVGMLPYNTVVTEAMVQEKSILEYATDDVFSDKIKDMWININDILQM